MVLADWIAIAVILGLAALGALLGFGKGLKFFTSGILGLIISVFLCYCFGGLILKINFVQELLAKFAALWNTKEGFFYNLLTKIHVELIVYYIVLFLIAQLFRIVIVRILKRIVEIKFIVFKIINKVLGAVLFVGMGILLTLVIFQIFYWVQGEAGSLFSYLEKSKFLGGLYRNNPLASLVDYVKSVASGLKDGFLGFSLS